MKGAKNDNVTLVRAVKPKVGKKDMPPKKEIKGGVTDKW